MDSSIPPERHASLGPVKFVLSAIAQDHVDPEGDTVPEPEPNPEERPDEEELDIEEPDSQVPTVPKPILL